MVYQFYSQASVMCLEVEADHVKVGDRLGFALPTGFLEEEVTSIHVNNKKVERANKGERACLLTKYSRNEVGEKTVVYLGNRA